MSENNKDMTDKNVFARLFPYMIEIRCLGDYKYDGKTVFCHTENPVNLKNEVLKRNQNGNVYFTFNRVKEEFRFRESFIESTEKNPVFKKAGRGETTSDQDIESREWFVIDVDAKRKNDMSGISSTDEEKAGAWDVTNRVKSFLLSKGFYAPVVCDSGNGYHLFFKIHEQNTSEIRDSLRIFLAKLSDLFSNEQANIDTTMFNAARIIRLYGTTTKKGKNYPSRPHRKSAFLEIPEDVENKINNFDLIKNIIGDVEETTKSEHKEDENKYATQVAFVKEKLVAWNQPYEEDLCEKGLKLFLKNGCPFNPEHKGKDSYIQIFKSGVILFKCSHNSCQDNGWPEFRKLFEPDYLTWKERDEQVVKKLEDSFNEKKEKTEKVKETVKESVGKGKFNPVDIIRHLDVSKNKKGEITGIKSTLANYHIIMSQDPRFAGKFRLNSLLDREEFNGQLITDETITRISVQISHDYLGLSNTNMVDSIATMLCHENKVDPFMSEFVATLPEWDGESRISKTLIDVCGAEDSPYTRAVSKLLFMGIIHRTFKPGCNFPYMPILWGGQGTGKSTFCKRLSVRQEWFRENIMPLDDKKRFVEQFSGGIIGEWSELVGMTKAETESVKAHISATDDSHRKSYAKRVSEMPRRCVFIATSNIKDVLKDTTGNRRFLPIEFTTSGSLLNTMLKGREEWDTYIKQCYAEALMYFYAGDGCELPEELRKVAEEKAEESMIEDRNQYVFDKWLSDYIQAQHQFEPEQQRWKVYLHEFMQQCKDDLLLGQTAYPTRVLKPLFNKCPYIGQEKREKIKGVNVWAWDILVKDLE